MRIYISNHAHSTASFLLSSSVGHPRLITNHGALQIRRLVPLWRQVQIRTRCPIETTDPGVGGVQCAVCQWTGPRDVFAAGSFGTTAGNVCSSRSRDVCPTATAATVRVESKPPSTSARCVVSSTGWSLCKEQSQQLAVCLLHWSQSVWIRSWPVCLWRFWYFVYCCSYASGIDRERLWRRRWVARQRCIAPTAASIPTTSTLAICPIILCVPATSTSTTILCTASTVSAASAALPSTSPQPTTAANLVHGRSSTAFSVLVYRRCVN